MNNENNSNCKICGSILCAGILALTAVGQSAYAQVTSITMPVDVQAQRYDLYRDPYTGNTIKFGGFSGLFPVPGRPDWVYVVTDRGPNPDCTNEITKVVGKIFTRPDFGSQIATIHLHPCGIGKIAEIKPLKNPNPSGGLISGLPPTPTVTRQTAEILWDINLNVVPNDEDGIDTEGLTMDEWGHFWICEEYKPSIAMVDKNGKVLLRLVPKGTLKGTETIPSYDILPKILKERYNNRGLEGIAYANGFVYAIMQRPLSNPTAKVSEKSQNIRIVAIDLHAVLRGNMTDVVKQYIYRTEAFVAPFTSNKGIYASDLFALSATKFLVPERQTDKLFCFNITGATDVTPLEDSEGVLLHPYNLSMTNIEQLVTMQDLTDVGITPVSKTVVLNSLTAIDPVLAKCEGVCVIGDTIILTHDNDFNVNPATAVATPNPGGPAVQINLQDPANLPRLFLVPMPPGIVP